MSSCEPGGADTAPPSPVSAQRSCREATTVDIAWPSNTEKRPWLCHESSQVRVTSRQRGPAASSGKAVGKLASGGRESSGGPTDSSTECSEVFLHKNASSRPGEASAALGDGDTLLQVVSCDDALGCVDSTDRGERLRPGAERAPGRSVPRSSVRTSH